MTFFSIAGHYFLMNAQFLAAVHIIVYAGAIMVLFMYVIMMLNLNNLETEKRSNVFKLSAVVAAGLLMTVLSGAIQTADQITLAEKTTGTAGLVENLGIALYRNYLLPFELASVLFLAAMVGAVYLSKKNLNETQA
jgi:NADH-quinone oxidoreductase subunit J